MTLYTAKQFSVDSHGAYLTELTDSAENPILFEQTMLGDKRRGGAHVCLPYFGPDASGVLPQHGFGRDVEWDVEILNGNEISCVYEEMEGDFSTGFRARILYSMSETESSFTTALLIANSLKRKGPFSISPGFHPYFAVDPSNARLNGKPISLADFEPFKEFPSTPEMTLQSAGRTITVSSNDLQHMIVWTDARGDYLCVEPTLGGNGFDSTRPGDTILNIGDIANYGYTISWG